MLMNIGRRPLFRTLTAAAALAALLLAGCSNGTAETLATVNGRAVTDAHISQRTTLYRAMQGIPDDASWAAWLVENGHTQESFDRQILEDAIQDECIMDYAERNGIAASDEEIRSMLYAAADGTADDGLAYYLSLTDMSEEARLHIATTALTAEAVLEQAVPFETPSDEEVLDFARTYQAVLGIAVPEGGLNSVDQLNDSDYRKARGNLEGSLKFEAQAAFVEELVSRAEIAYAE